MVCNLEVASHFRIKLRSTCNMGTHTRGVRKGFSSDITCLYPKGFFWKFAKEGLIYMFQAALSAATCLVCAASKTSFFTHFISILPLKQLQMSLNLFNTFPYKTCYINKFFYKNYLCTPSKFSLYFYASNYHATRKEVQNTLKLL